MAKSKTRRRQAQPAIRVPEEQARPRWFGFATWLAIAVVAAGVAFWVAKRQAQHGAKQIAPPPVGLPHTPDYHALLGSPSDPRRITLGTHAGLYESIDGGRTWRKGQLARKDAMNLVRVRSGRLWAAGHNVLFASDDGGRTWEAVHPSGLPGLDLHGFAADPSSAKTLYAAVAGKGLYRSRDGGRTYSLVTKEVGPGAFGLAVTPSGRILAAEPRHGLFASGDHGRTWSLALMTPIVGVAVNPANPKTVLATGEGIFLSHDGGKRWRKAFAPPKGAGPVAWAPSDPKVAYAVGFDRRLYRSGDSGATWRPVS